MDTEKFEYSFVILQWLRLDKDFNDLNRGIRLDDAAFITPRSKKQTGGTNFSFLIFFSAWEENFIVKIYG